MAETLDVTSMLPNRFEPKRNNRWILMIEGIDAYIVKGVSRPKFTLGEKEIPWINSRRYISGNGLKYETMEVKLHDPIAPSGAQQVMEWIRLHHESISGRAGYADFYKRDIQLKMLDPIGTVIELWDIKGAMITAATFGGEMTYESEDLQEISLTLRFDAAILQY